MKISDAVRKYMRVPRDAGNSVAWESTLTPYVVEAMNCLSSRSYDAVVFVAPARTGKTLGLIDGWISYNIVCDPSDMLVVQMTQDKAQEHSKRRLAKMFRHSPAIARRLSPHRNDNNVHDKTFRDGSFLKIGWPSINVFSSSDFKCVALTDYDRFPEDVDGEGDAFSLASKRTTTFMSLGMTLVESSPGREITDTRWKPSSPHEAPPTTGILSLYNRGDRRRWYWPCPHCGEYFQPSMANMTGYRHIADPMEASEAARIQCPHCHKLTEPQQKRELNNRGVWLREGQHIDRDGNITGDAVRAAVMARAGYEEAQKDNPYNCMTLRELARISLVARGTGVSSMNPMQMIGMAFTHSTSDFGNILLDVANKSILQGWQEAPETFDAWTKKGQLSDFRIAHRVGMGGFSSLRQVREGAEYKYVTTGDKQATIALATYGELFSITRQAIINDDMNMLTDIPMKLGRAAKATIADLVYDVLISNQKLSSDNVALFDKTKHANVLEKAVMDVASLDKARQLMRMQKEGDRHLNIRPAFVLVPTAMESVSNQVIKSVSVKGADINAGIINPVKDFATVIAEPRLDDASQSTFYLTAAKGSDTVEVAYLNGVDEPYIDQQEGFTVDGVTTKVRIDAGVAPVDYRGMVKCTV
ncbi:hypothetical protein FHL29_23190 [Salmonella enterica]|nr:hypothetical protein [Salmonella enterica]EDS4829116.1 hypothetical protein [Salmonella enterica subsp. enterica serovar Mississippi]